MNLQRHTKAIQAVWFIEWVLMNTELESELTIWHLKYLAEYIQENTLKELPIKSK